MVAKSGGTGQKVLAEPYIDNYVRFNSNSGWVVPGGAVNG